MNLTLVSGTWTFYRSLDGYVPTGRALATYYAKILSKTSIHVSIVVVRRANEGFDRVEQDRSKSARIADGLIHLLGVPYCVYHERNFPRNHQESSTRQSSITSSDFYLERATPQARVNTSPT